MCFCQRACLVLSQCLADKSAVVLAPAPPFPKPASSPSPLQRVAQLLTTLLTRKYDAGNRVFEPDATVLLDYLDVDWRTAPWAHLDSSEPFGSYAAALRTSHTAADVGIVLRVWESWLVRPVFGTDALTWFSSRDAAVERVPRGITAALLLELRRHVVDSEPSFACTLDGSSYGGNVRRIGATLRLQVM